MEIQQIVEQNPWWEDKRKSKKMKMNCFLNEILSLLFTFLRSGFLNYSRTRD